MSKVTIEEIGERLNSLDSVYFKELVSALQELKYSSKSSTIRNRKTTKRRKRFL